MNVDKSKHRIELFITIISTIFIYLVSSYYDILERIVDFTRQYEKWQLDEFVTVSIFLVIAFSILLYRRWRDILLSEERLRLQNKELQAAIEEIRQLRGIIPICSSCKRIRDGSGLWHQIELFISDHSEAEFSHGICPDCEKKLYPDSMDEVRQNDKSSKQGAAGPASGHTKLPLRQ